MEPPLLVPSTNLENKPQATFINRHGDVVYLPNQALIPFVRLAARNGVKHIKCFHIMNTYCSKCFDLYLCQFHSAILEHSKIVRAAILDIIIPDIKKMA